MLPEGLTSLGESVFYGSESLKDVYLPESLKEIPESLFGYDKPDVTMHCKEGSAAYQYALRFGYKIKLEENLE